MKKLVSFLGMAIAALFMSGAAFAQSLGENHDPGNIILVNTDGTKQVFEEGEEWEITFSNVDSLGNEYKKPVAFTIVGGLMCDTTNIVVQDLDSMYMYQPEAIMQEGVFEITRDYFQYIDSVKSHVWIVFKKDIKGKLPLPSIGQHVVCNIFESPLPVGFMGICTAVNTFPDGAIEMRCEGEVKSLKEFYKQVVYLGSGELQSEEAKLSRAQRASLKRQMRRKNSASNSDNLTAAEKKLVESMDGIQWDKSWDSYQPELTFNLKAGPVSIAPTLSWNISYRKCVKANVVLFGDDEDDGETIGAYLYEKKTLRFKFSVEASLSKEFEIPGVGIHEELDLPFQCGFSGSLGIYVHLYAYAKVTFDFPESTTYSRTKLGKSKDQNEAPSTATVGSSDFIFSGEVGGEASLRCGFDCSLTLLGVVTQVALYVGAGIEGKINFSGGNEWSNAAKTDPDAAPLPSLMTTNFDNVYDGNMLGVGLCFGANFTIASVKLIEEKHWLFTVAALPKLDFKYALYPTSEKNSDGLRKYTFAMDPSYHKYLEMAMINKNEKNYAFWFRDERYGTYQKADWFTLMHDPLGKFPQYTGSVYLEPGAYYYAYPVIWHNWSFCSQGPIFCYRAPYEVTTKDSKSDGWNVQLNATYDEFVVDHMETEKHEITYGFQYAETGQDLSKGRMMIFTNKLQNKDFSWTVDYDISQIQYEGFYNYRAFVSSDGDYMYGEAKSFRAGTKYQRPIFISAENVVFDSAVLNGEISDKLYEELNRDGAFEVGFECYPEGKVDEIKSVRVSTLNHDRTYTANMKGLIQNTKYVCRAFAVNSKGTQYSGTEGTFTTEKAYVVKDISANADAFNATVSCKVTEYIYRNHIRTVVSCSEDAKMPSSNRIDIEVSPDANGNISCEFTGLNPITPYYVKVFFEDERENDLIEGEGYTTFETKNPYEVTIAEPSTSFAKTVFKGGITSYLSTASEEKSGKFYYARKASDLGSDKCKSVDAVFVDGNMEVTGEVKTLDYNTTYNYKFVLTAGGKDWESDVVTFKTPDPYSVSTKDTSHPDNDKWSTSLNGSITSVALDMYKNNQGNLQVYFEYATEQFFFDEDRADVIYAPIEGTTVTATPKLLYNTQYLYRIVLDANGTKHKGSIKKCKTCDIMQCETGEATATEECVTIKGWISPEAAYTSTTTTTNSLGQQEKIHSVTAYIDYSDEEAMHNPKSIAVDFNTETGDFSKDIYTMEYDTTYYYRTRLVIDGQEVMGELKSVKTLEYDPGQIVDKNKKR